MSKWVEWGTERLEGHVIWSTMEIKKDAECGRNPHGCRLVNDGMVCKDVCNWLRYNFPENEGT